jgi:NAD+ synthase (glutamine-hydrolysing)
MKLLKVAAAALNQTPLDWENNLQNIVDAIGAARESGATILCLPELCITGYGCEDAFHSPGVLETAKTFLLRLLPETNGMVVSVGLPVIYAGAVFNAAALIVDGAIAGLVCKQHLAGDGIHYEPRWFKPWPEGINGEIEIGDVKYPVGDLLFDVGGFKLGFEICEDAWVGTRPGSSLSSRGVDVVLNPSASHFAFGKHSVRQRFVLEGSRAFHVTYLYANLCGNESGRAIFDGDVMIASAGKMLNCGERLSFKPFVVTTATVDVAATRMSRARTGSFEPDVDGDETDVIAVDFDWPECELAQASFERPSWETGEDLKYEEFTRSVCLGLFDYLRKSRSRGFVVSLSGGVDSAAVSVLAFLAIKLAEMELGFENLCQRLSIEGLESVEEIAEAMITTAYQGTRNSGEVTRNAAEEVANAIHATHYELDVDSLVEDYKKMIEGALERELTWESDDITLQNIQARVRSPGIWMFANINRALLLSTSNRSESAVGYATMDGDTSGGLSPIAGIDKAFLRKWLVWMEKTGPNGFEPIAELAAVNAQQPTAELRPADQNQTDEGDLMPYEVLDKIERWAIRDKLLPVEVFKHLKVEYVDQTDQQLCAWTVRFFRLWCRNQWKRERYAPSFHLDDENLDPKTWCRFPILSGGYEYEIRQLEALVNG